MTKNWPKIQIICICCALLTKPIVKNLQKWPKNGPKKNRVKNGQNEARVKSFCFCFLSWWIVHSSSATTSSMTTTSLKDHPYTHSSSSSSSSSSNHFSNKPAHWLHAGLNMSTLSIIILFNILETKSGRILTFTYVTKCDRT